MKAKPTHEDLMDYLYGEIQEADRKNIESWLKQHPETLKEMEDLRMVRGVLGKVQDQEIIDPYFYTGKNTAAIWQTARIFSNTIIKPVIALAAAISLMILAGYLTDLNIIRTNGDLSVRFGNEQPSKQIDQKFVEKVVADMLEKEQVLQVSDMKNIEGDLKAQFDSYYQEQQNNFQNAVYKNTPAKSDDSSNNEALARIVKQMQEDNLDYLERYLEISNRSQERYIKATLTEFSEFLADQREEDLKRIQFNLTTLKESQNLQKMETDEILARIYNTVNDNNEITN